jgi:hypothetical protein
MSGSVKLNGVFGRFRRISSSWLGTLLGHWGKLLSVSRNSSEGMSRVGQ